jgi:hypothetical protein
MALRRIGTAALIAGVFFAQSGVAGAQEREQRGPSSGRSAMLATLGGNLADIFTTLTVINSGAGRESNPILGEHPARIIATKSLLLVPQLLAERHLARHGHPKAAMWLGVALGGVGTAMAIHNMNVGR